MKNNEFDEFITGEPIEEVKLDINEVQKNIPQYSNEKLCEMIVCDRYFGFGEKIAPFCMEELSKRRIAGDTFDFESYINWAHSSLPILDFTIPDIRSALSKIIGGKISSK